MLTEEQLIQVRRHLHEIPELALHEFQTHDYLLKVIHGFNQDRLEILVPEKLPTAILVLVHGSAPQRTIGYRTDIDALRWRNRPGCPMPLTIRASCTPVGTTST